jgi:hypothetical protein
VQFGIL